MEAIDKRRGAIAEPCRQQYDGLFPPGEIPMMALKLIEQQVTRKVVLADASIDLQ